MHGKHGSRSAHKGEKTNPDAPTEPIKITVPKAWNLRHIVTKYFQTLKVAKRISFPHQKSPEDLTNLLLLRIRHAAKFADNK